MSKTISSEKIIEELKANRANRQFTTPVIPSRFHFHVGVDRVLDFLTAENDVLYHLNRKRKKQDEILGINKIKRMYEMDYFDIDEQFAIEDLEEIRNYVVNLQEINLENMPYSLHIHECLNFCKDFVEYRNYKLTKDESQILSMVQDIILNLLLIKDIEFSLDDFIDASTLESSLAYISHIPDSQEYHCLIMATKVKKINYNLNNI